MADESAGIRVLRDIRGGPWDLVAVLTTGSTGGRRGVSVGEVAAALGYPVWPAQEVATIRLAERLHAANVDVLLNIHSLLKIHPAVVGSVRVGGFNLHPGPLPAYAGLNAPSWAIAHGEKYHAVTLHWLSARIDSGPIAFATTFGLTERDTGLSVSAKCVELGLPLVRRLLETAQSNPDAIPRVPQDLSGRRYFGRRDVPYGGRVPWAQPAHAVDAFIRACDYDPMPSPWGAPLASLGSHDIGIAKVRQTSCPCTVLPGVVGTVDSSGAEVATADEWLLVKQLHVEGRRVQTDALLKAGLRLS